MSLVFNSSNSQSDGSLEWAVACTIDCLIAIGFSRRFKRNSSSDPAAAVAAPNIEMDTIVGGAGASMHI